MIEPARPGPPLPKRSLLALQEQLWQQGKQPDPFAFLESARRGREGVAALPPPDVLAAVLAVDQWQRWQIGQRVPAEEYLERCPDLPGVDDVALEVIYGEFLVRQGLGEQPSPAEYLDRFPQFAARLQEHFALFQALEAGAGDQPERPPAPGTSESQHPATPTLIDCRAILADLGAVDLLEPPRLAELTRLLEQQPLAPIELGRELLRRDWLTPYQVNQLLVGRGRELVLGGCILLARLGRGGMGQVFKARQCSHGQIVALKVIRADRLSNPDAVRRFLREVRAVSRLNHPNIVRAVAAGQERGHPFLVMEYIDGIDLAQLLAQQGRFAVSVACEIIRQAALGLQHAHEHGLIHRDVKPSNLILKQPPASLEACLRPGQEFPVVKLLDLGLVLHRGLTAGGSLPLTRTGVVLGTAEFIAPEQIRNSRGAGPPADLYSLGCTFYFLLAGRPPFAGKTLGLKLLQHDSEEAEPIESLRPEVPAPVAAMVRRLLAKKPADRFPSAGELAVALADILRACQ